MRRKGWLFAAWVPLGLAAGVAAQAAPGGLPGVEWDELTKAIQEIEAAAKPDQAMAAYARGCTQNRQSVKLQKAYMRRMLKFGRPDLAYNPAKELTQLEPRDAVAWGVIGYKFAKQGQYVTAMPGAFKAVTLEPENPSICQNAAQLLVWYEGAQRSPVSAQVRSLMTKVKRLTGTSKVLASAYKSAKQRYTKLDKDKGAKKKAADEATNEAKKAHQKYEQLQDKLKTAGRSYDSEKRRYDRLRYDVARAEDQIRRARDHRARISAERRRESVVRSIRSSQDNVRKHLRDGKKIRDDMKKAKDEHESKRSKANRLHREAAAVADGVPDTFGWLPPAVDGVVTPDAAVAAGKPRSASRKPVKPSSSYLAPDRPTPKSTKPTQSLTELVAEAEAADKLSLAKICMDSKDAGMKAKAKQLLQEVITKYPSTKAAGEAQKLVGKLP